MKSWKNLLEFLKNYWYIGVLILFIIPLILNLLMPVVNFGVGSNDGWLGFWGGYLGSILSGVVAYGIARYQMSQEKEKEYKNRIYDLLPYFNLDGGWNSIENEIQYSINLFVSTKENNLPILKTQLIAYFIIEKESNKASNDKKHKYIYIDNIGHVFPNKKIIDMKIPREVNEAFYKRWDNHDDLILDRLDIKYYTVDETEVFFTYGDGINGVHSYLKDNEYYLYVKDEKFDQEKFDNRKKEFDKIKNYKEKGYTYIRHD